MSLEGLGVGRGQCGWSGVSEREGDGEAGGQPAPRGLVSSWEDLGHCRALSTGGTAADFGGIRCSGCRGTSEEAASELPVGSVVAENRVAAGEGTRVVRSGIL